MLKNGRASARHRVGAGVALLLTVAIVAGCGSSKATTVAQFKQQIDAVCKSSRSDASTKAQAAQIEKSSASVAVKAEKLLALEEPFLKRLAAVKPPAGNSTAEQLHDAFTAILTNIPTIESDVKDAGQHVSALTSAQTTIKTNGAVVQRDDASLGLTDCE